jgi:hypothetical protein
MRNKFVFENSKDLRAYSELFSILENIIYNSVTGLVFVYLVLGSLIFTPLFGIAYPQVEEGNTEGTPTKTTHELSCESIPDSGLLCGNSDLDLCILRTDMSDVNVSDMWNIVNPMLCEAGQ